MHHFPYPRRYAPSSSAFSLLVVLLPLLLSFLTADARSGGKRANIRVLPVFEELPQPLIYYRPQVPVKLVCRALPSTARVQLVFRTPGDSNFQSLSGVRQGSVSYSVQNADNVRGADLHCKAESTLGQVLSRPIRLVRTVLNASSADRFTRTYTFYRGNVAQVMCAVPFSQPAAEVQFFKDDDRIGQLDKYKIVRIDNRKVVMLIKEFSSADTGIYSCRATNPYTLEHVNVQQRVQLKIESPTARITARLHVEDPFRTKKKKVVLREGDNATLYCLPEGAPIPSVKWYRHSNTKRLPDNAHIDPTFGTLQLTRVGYSDASVYMCSVEQGTAGSIIRTSPVTVVVLPRLKIIKAPTNVKVKKLGAMVKFKCTVSGSCPDGRNCLAKDQVRPEWYHNGKYLSPRQVAPDIVIREGSLTIRQVTKENLGVYQCVARSKTEWDSASAALALSNEKIVTGAQWQRMEEKRKAKKPRPRKPKPSPPRQPPRRPYTEERPYRKPPPSSNPDYRPSRRPLPSRQEPLMPPPNVKLLYDNLAVELTWLLPASGVRPAYYRLQYRERKSQRSVNGMPRSWDTEMVHSIEARIFEQRFVVLKELKANYVYRFRVTAVFPTSKTVASEWSREADFSHVIPAKPSITAVNAIGSNALRISWTYDHPEGYPQLDGFVLLSRRLLNKMKGTYGGYSEQKIKANQRSIVISKLHPDTDYQMVIYGRIEKQGRRRRLITLFSSAISKRTEAAGRPLGPSLGTNSADSTKLMFWILGGLASVMVLVMAILVAMCFLRQRREKKRSRAALHAQVNGTSLDSYKDPAKLLHRRQHAKAQAQANSQFLLAQLAGPNSPTSGTGTWSGPAPNQVPPGAYLRGSSASVQHMPGVPPGSGVNLNVVPETQSLMLDHLAQQHGQHDMGTELGYGPAGMFPMHPHHNGTLGSKSHLGLQHHPHVVEHDLVDSGYPTHTGSVGPYRPLGSGYAPFMSGGLRPSHLDVRPPPTGDAESIYSYFSQQEMGVQHCGLSDVPGAPPTFRPQLAEAGSQTTDRQQHRHHRRRRRKQPPGSVPPTGPGGPLPTALEHSLAPSPPVMRDMAVNTDMSSDGTYDRPGNGHHHHPQHPQHPPHHQQLPHGYHHHHPQQHPAAMMQVSSAGPMPPQFEAAVSPPARLASLGYASQPTGDLGPSDASTLTRRGTPTLFVDPPKMRDYSEYAIPETKA